MKTGAERGEFWKQLGVSKERVKVGGEKTGKETNFLNIFGVVMGGYTVVKIVNFMNAIQMF